MRRLLPPLVILLILVAVGIRVLQRPACEGEQEHIRALINDPSRGAQTLEQINSFAGTCSGTEDRWFAAEATLRVGRWELAIDRVFKDWDLGRTGAGAARFGRVGLEVLGWRDPAHEQPNANGELQALIALVEAGEPWAEEMLRRRAGSDSLESVRPLLFYASRFATRKPLEVIIAGFRVNPGATQAEREALLTAAAFSALGREPYPERESDIDRLIAAVKNLRVSNEDAWIASAMALGRSEAPRAIKVLRRQAEKLDRSRQPADQNHLRILRCALIAAGDWDAYAALQPDVEERRPHPFLLAWYLEALLHRFNLQDEKARIPLGDVWLFLGPDDDLARLRIAFSLLLPETLPEMATDKQRGPIRKMVEDLLRMQNTPLGRVLGLAFLIRTGEPEAVGRMVEVLRQIAAAWELDPVGRDAEMRPAWIAALRALCMYADTPQRTG